MSGNPYHDPKTGRFTNGISGSGFFKKVDKKLDVLKAASIIAGDDNSKKSSKIKEVKVENGKRSTSSKIKETVKRHGRYVADAAFVTGVGFLTDGPRGAARNLTAHIVGRAAANTARKVAERYPHHKLAGSAAELAAGYIGYRAGAHAYNRATTINVDSKRKADSGGYRPNSFNKLPAPHGLERHVHNLKAHIALEHKKG